MLGALFAALVLSAGVGGEGASPTVKSDAELAMKMYARYLNGEISARHYGYDETIGEFLAVESEPRRAIDRFCIYDVENDGIPELYVYLEAANDVGWICFEDGVLNNYFSMTA
jgi:hypothetical protein